jgi:hypothetical protein
MELQISNGKGPHQLLRAGSRSASGEVTIGGILNRLNFCIIFVVYTQFTNVAAS